MAEEPTKLDISDEMIAERRGGSGKMPNDMPSWQASSIVNIDESKDVFQNIDIARDFLEEIINYQDNYVIDGENSLVWAEA